MPQEKEEKEEKENEEKFRRSPFATLFLGLIVILAGVFLFLATQGYIEWGDWWAYFLLSVGFVLIIDVFARQIVPEYRRPIFGRLIGGLVLICIGAGNIYGLRGWWPLIIIAMGILILVHGWQRSRRPR
jgi:hypothetical protein